MKKTKTTISFIVSLLLSVATLGQQEYFVFIQQPQGHPFYVRMQEESHSSSASGHLILSTLRDSVYNMYVGFPRSRAGEQLFSVPIGKKDRGFELRQANGRWVLYDLLSQESILSATRAQDTALVRKTDTYSVLMAGVVDDSTVLYRYPDTTAAKAAAVADSASQVDEPGEGLPSVETTEQQQPDTSAAQRAPKGKTNNKKARAKKEEPAVADTAKQQSLPSGGQAIQAPAAEKVGGPVHDPRDIIRFGSENLVEGRLIIYLDRTGPVIDTIRIVIPR